MGLDALAGYENHDGLLLSNGADVIYEHSETWTFTTGEQGVLRFVTVHKVVRKRRGKITVWKDYWDMNSLVSFAPPNHFEGLAIRGYLVDLRRDGPRLTPSSGERACLYNDTPI